MRAQEDWMIEAEDALTRKQIDARGAGPMDRLLGDDGILAALRAKGYTVDGPVDLDLHRKRISPRIPVPSPAQPSISQQLVCTWPCGPTVTAIRLDLRSRGGYGDVRKSCLSSVSPERWDTTDA